MKSFLKKCAASVGIATITTAGLFSPVMADEASNLLRDMDPTNNSSGLKISGSAGAVFRNVITIVFIVAALLTFFYLLVGAINWITSGGDKGKVEDARNKITSAVIGLLLIAATWAIYQLVMTVAFGTDTKGVTIPYLAS